MRLESLLERLGSLLQPSEALLEPLESLLGASWERLGVPKSSLEGFLALLGLQEAGTKRTFFDFA